MVEVGRVQKPWRQRGREEEESRRRKSGRGMGKEEEAKAHILKRDSVENGLSTAHAVSPVLPLCCAWPCGSCLPLPLPCRCSQREPLGSACGGSGYLRGSFLSPGQLPRHQSSLTSVYCSLQPASASGTGAGAAVHMEAQAHAQAQARALAGGEGQGQA